MKIENCGLKGFLCPLSDEPVKFEVCFRECQGKCGYSLPLLVSLSEEYAVYENVYHVTETLNPPRIIQWKRSHPYFSAPEDLVWMMFGRGFHSAIETSWNKKRDKIITVDDRLGAEHWVEEGFTADVGGYEITGRVDLWEPGTKTLLDYKTTGSYFIKKLRSDGWKSTTYDNQLNIYRALGFPDAEHLKLECLVKDWSRWMKFNKDGTIKNGAISIIERIDVPIYDAEEVKEGVKKSIEESLEVPTRDCTTVERWGGNRCAHYCEVSKANDCPQYERKG